MYTLTVLSGSTRTTAPSEPSAPLPIAVGSTNRLRPIPRSRPAERALACSARNASKSSMDAACSNVSAGVMRS